jgi:hypothetical protein
MAPAAIIVALLALSFTIGSFWWLHARRGALTAPAPRAYAFADQVRLRLPLAFFNTGAPALIVSDLRVVVDPDGAEMHLPWTTTRSKLRPESDDGFAFPTPFAVPGRGTREVIAEFGHNEGWHPDASSKHRVRLQALVHPSDEWVNVVDFDWWAPNDATTMGKYLAHPNEPV